MKNVIENQQVTGFAWKPGSRLISYGVPVAFEFFMSNDVTNVRGLMQVDVGSSTISNLVLPRDALPLAHPVWSHAGNIVAFEEISQMEGRGTFHRITILQRQNIRVGKRQLATIVFLRTTARLRMIISSIHPPAPNKFLSNHWQAETLCRFRMPFLLIMPTGLYFPRMVSGLRIMPRRAAWIPRSMS